MHGPNSPGGPSDGQGDGHHPEVGGERSRRVPPHGAMTTVARFAWLGVLVVLLLFGVTLDPATGPLGATGGRAFLGLAVALLLYQAGFIAVYPGAAASPGVLVPATRSSSWFVDSPTRLRRIALLDVGLALFLLYRGLA